MHEFVYQSSSCDILLLFCGELLSHYETLVEKEFPQTWKFQTDFNDLLRSYFCIFPLHFRGFCRISLSSWPPYQLLGLTSRL